MAKDNHEEFKVTLHLHTTAIVQVRATDEDSALRRAYIRVMKRGRTCIKRTTVIEHFDVEAVDE